MHLVIFDIFKVPRIKIKWIAAALSQDFERDLYIICDCDVCEEVFNGILNVAQRIMHEEFHPKLSVESKKNYIVNNYNLFLFGDHIFNYCLSEIRNFLTIMRFLIDFFKF